MFVKTLEQKLQHDFRIRLDKDLAKAVASYHHTLEEAGVGGTVNDTFREILSMGLGAVKEDQEALRTRARAFNLTRVWLFQHVHRQLKQLIQHLEMEITPEVLREYGLPPLPPLLSPLNDEANDGSEQ